MIKLEKHKGKNKQTKKPSELLGAKKKGVILAEVGDRFVVDNGAQARAELL